jgi:hypothetical protein
MRTKGLIVAGLAALLFSGCQDDPIESYKVPKSAVRMRAATFPNGDFTWVFKVIGPADQVAKHQKEIDRFLASIRFVKDNEPPVWQTPAGWRQGPKKTMRWATLLMGPGDSPLELTVVPMGQNFGSLLANVNRWRGQIGLDPIDEGELDRFLKHRKINDVSVTLVDMTGYAS